MRRRFVGRAEEDVGRAALCDDLFHGVRQARALDLDEVRAEDARKAPQRRERDRLGLVEPLPGTA